MSFANKQLALYWCPDLNDRFYIDDGIYSSAKVASFVWDFALAGIYWSGIFKSIKSFVED